MRMTHGWLAATAWVVLAAAWLVPADAAACSCLPSFEEDLYEASDHVIKARPLASFRGPRDQRWYLAIVTGRAYKGCLFKHAFVWIQTTNEEEGCGVRLDADTEYLIHGHAMGRAFGLHVLETGLCDDNRPVPELSEATRRFLDTRQTCCGGECECVGSEPVDCLVDPCQTSVCSEPEAVCQANYCGGCHAEWYDADGWRVCLETPSR
ncbi:MAG: hypothetical protein ABW321_35335 [Polyangiales bacterium]